MGENVTNSVVGPSALAGTEQLWALAGILLIVVAAGLLGGWGARLLTQDSPPAVGEPAPPGWRFLILGVIAASCVPLFLSLVQSGLISEIMNNGNRRRLESYLIFAGLCLVAALTARNFLDTLSKRVLRDLERVDEKATKAVERAETATRTAEAAAEAVDEQDAKPTKGAGAEPETAAEREKETEAGGEAEARVVEFSPAELPSISEDERLVLAALTRMTFRTVGGTAEAANMNRDRVADLLESLAAKGLATRTVSPKTGGPRWKITPSGIAVLNSAR